MTLDGIIVAFYFLCRHLFGFALHCDARSLAHHVHDGEERLAARPKAVKCHRPLAPWGRLAQKGSGESRTLRPDLTKRASATTQHNNKAGPQ